MGRKLGPTPEPVVRALEDVFRAKRDLKAAQDRFAIVLGQNLRARIIASAETDGVTDRGETPLTV